jgi:hypothetical protein
LGGEIGVLFLKIFDCGVGEFGAGVDFGIETGFENVELVVDGVESVGYCC